MGHMLMDAAQTNGGKRKRTIEVSTFIEQAAMLRDAPIPHLGTLLTAILDNKYRRPQVHRDAPQCGLSRVCWRWVGDAFVRLGVLRPSARPPGLPGLRGLPAGLPPVSPDRLSV